MKTRISFLILVASLAPVSLAQAAPTSVISKVEKVRARNNGSIYVVPVASTGCTDDLLYATTDKTHNEKILKIATAALLGDRDVKIEYDSSTCQIAWIEMR